MTIVKMTNQEVFDKVYNHLVMQGEQSSRRDVGYNTCAYRGEMGLSCAIGCLIPEESYYVSMESFDVIEVGEMYPELFEFRQLPFLAKLQKIHDGGFNKKSLDVSFAKLAEEFCLEFKRIENV